MILVRGAMEHDIENFAPRLRVSDAAECQAMGMTSVDVLWESARCSHEVWTAEEDGAPIAMWGYAADGVFGDAEAWLFTAPEIERHKRLFLRLNREFLAYVLGVHGVVTCSVHLEYRTAVKWLAWLGFQPDRTILVNGAEFLQMRLRRQ